MASGPITSWQIDGRKVEIVTDFIFLGSKITGNCDCSHEIKRHLLKKKKKKRHLLLEENAMANLVSILESSDITLPTKTWIIKAMVFQ